MIIRLTSAEICVHQCRWGVVKTATQTRETASKAHVLDEQSCAAITERIRTQNLLTFRTSSMAVVGATALSLLLITPSKIPCATTPCQNAVVTPQMLVQSIG